MNVTIMAITINLVMLPVRPFLMVCIPDIFFCNIKSAPYGALSNSYWAQRLSLSAFPALNPTDLEAAI